MRPILSARVRLAATFAVLATAASGCSYFTKTKKLDMQPFAENTVTAIGEMRKIESPPIWIRLRPHSRHPSLAETRRSRNALVDLVRAVNAYSLQVVSLNDSRISDRNKARELARFLRGASQKALLEEADDAEIALTPARLEEILKAIDGKERYQDALLAAEPIVNAVLARGLDLANALDGAILDAARAIEADVQAENREMLANRAALVAVQESTMQALAWAESIAYGDDAAADELRKNVPVLAEHLPAGRKPGMKDQQAMVAVLGAQALRVKAALDQMDPQYQAYRESIVELDTLRAKAVENSKLARTVLILWSRSHKSLARGVEVPPMFDLGKVVMSNVSAATKGIVPQ
jgi:hypothetical protein